MLYFFYNQTLMKLPRIATVLLAFSTVTVSYAEDCSVSSHTVCLTKVGEFINNLNTMVVVTLGVLFLATAIVGFFFGVVRFIWAQQQGDEKGVKNGKETLKWGLIALFCAFSVYGIIQFAQSTLFPGADLTNVKIPKLIIDTTLPLTGDGRVPSGTVGDSSRVPSGTVGDSSRVPAGNTPNTNPSTGFRNILDGGRGSAGRCESGGYNGSFQNGNCVPDYSSPVATPAQGGSVTYCSFASIGQICDSGAGVCKNTQVGIECVPTSLTQQAVSGECNAKTFGFDCNNGNGTCKSNPIGYECVAKTVTADPQPAPDQTQCDYSVEGSCQ